MKCCKNCRWLKIDFEKDAKNKPYTVYSCSYPLPEIVLIKLGNTIGRDEYAIEMYGQNCSLFDNAAQKLKEHKESK